MNDTSFRELIKKGKWENNSKQWQYILSKIEIPKNRKYTFGRNKIRIFSGAAAVVLLLLTVALGYYYSGFNNFRKERLAIGYTTIFSPRGQRTSIILPDSTRVWLNSGSTLKYSTDYNQKMREVIAEGEAFFEVKKNPDKPFYVLVNEIKVKVYGTSFNVKAFPEENNIETTLIEGRLSIIPMAFANNPDKEIFLKPNEKCIYVKKTGAVNLNSGDENSLDKENNNLKTIHEVTIRKNISTEVESQWKEGKLVFENESFGELAIKLERWYDVKVHFVDNKIRDYKFTGSFDKETINQAMEALKQSSQKSYNYEIVFRDIYLKTK
jgi:ferric-dicitrate binding protein FerR (iron transport regulator)